MTAHEEQRHLGRQHLGEVDVDRRLAVDVDVVAGAVVRPGAALLAQVLTSSVVFSSCGEVVDLNVDDGQGVFSGGQRRRRWTGRRPGPRPARVGDLLQVRLSAACGPVTTSCQRGVVAGAEALRDQVVALAGGGGRRVVALVGVAEPHAEERDREQHDDRAAPPTPAGSCGRSTSSRPARTRTPWRAPCVEGAGPRPPAAAVRGSTLRPRKRSSAGSRVSDATMVRATAMATPMATP